MSSENEQAYDFLKLRKTYGLTQSDLGDLLKVSKNYICQIETGRKLPSETLIALARHVEQELRETSSADNLPASAQASKNAAFQYLEHVWDAARNDRDLQGYIITNLKLAFPLDRPPFVKSPERMD